MNLEDAPVTLGAELERERLVRRAQRIELVIGELRDREAHRRSLGSVPRPLTLAIDDFASQLAGVRRELRRR